MHVDGSNACPASTYVLEGSECVPDTCASVPAPLPSAFDKDTALYCSLQDAEYYGAGPGAAVVGIAGLNSNACWCAQRPTGATSGSSCNGSQCHTSTGSTEENIGGHTTGTTLSTPAIVGISIGAAVVLAVLIALLVFYVRKRKRMAQ